MLTRIKALRSDKSRESGNNIAFRGGLLERNIRCFSSDHIEYNDVEESLESRKVYLAQTYKEILMTQGDQDPRAETVERRFRTFITGLCLCKDRLENFTRQLVL
jgi:hypothetical protein